MAKGKKRRPNGKRTPKPRGKAPVFLKGLPKCYKMLPHFRQWMQGRISLAETWSIWPVREA